MDADSARTAPWAALPEIPLLPKVSPLARHCEVHRLATFHEVAAHVCRLPYGRNADPAHPRSVLKEGRGTCSTKHAFLARLAREHGFDVPLMLGIHLMDGDNTPGIGPVLREAGLAFLPEAHCTLHWGKSRVDLTGPNAPERDFWMEDRLPLEDFLGHKVRRHRAYLDQWRQDEGLVERWSVDALWTVRERCIAALAVVAPGAAATSSPLAASIRR